MAAPVSRWLRDSCAFASSVSTLLHVELIFSPICVAALVDSTASFLTSIATTEKPRPALPARAASISAFNASRLVCCAIEVITLISGVSAHTSLDM